MKCVILAAGEGKRVHPLTYTRPKVMLPIANKPIVEWNLKNAISAGFSDFIFVVAYKSEMVRNYFGKGEKWGIKIEYVNQGEPLGTAHAIGIVEKFVDDFVVLSGDTIFGKQDIKNIMKNKNCIGVINVDNVKDYGTVEIKDKNIQKIHEKIEDPIIKTINAGIYHFNKQIFDYIRKTKKSVRGEYEITDSINLMVNNNSNLEAIFLKEWKDIVYPWDLLDVNEELLKKIGKRIKGKVGKNAIVKDNVIIGKDTVVMSGSYIKGPVVIGQNCKIGPNCYIRPYSSIGNNCHVGNACEVKNSIIMDGSNVPHQNYVGDSIIGQYCNFGAGSKVANLRFDKKNITIVLNGNKINTGRKKLGVVMGDNTQTGINSMINIGSFIGNNVFIGPGAIVKGYIEPYSKIM